MKLVVNKCYGGFNISDKAVHRYAELKNIQLFPEVDPKYKSLKMTTWWTVPEDQRPKALEDWHAASMDERQAYNKAYEAATFSPREIPRDDETLVRVVEELGAEANGTYANLAVIEIPDDVGDNWHIDEYDGIETVHENHRSW